jgi:PAS domain S-box-containing protein
MRDLGEAVNDMAIALEARQRERDSAEGQRRRLAAIVEDADDAIISHTLAGQILTWNRSAERLFGFSAEEAVGQSLMMIVPPERAAELSTNLSLQRRGEFVSHGETERRRKDGSLVPVSLRLSPVRDEFGQVIGGAGVLRDISDRRHAERALRNAEERMRFALEAARIGVWEGDPKSGRFYWSETHEQMHGLVPGTFGGTLDAFMARVHPEDRDTVSRAIAEAVRTRRDVELEYRVVWSDASEHWIRASGHYSYNRDGAIVRAAGVAVDVTERRHLEEQLRQSQKMEAVGQLAGGVAHDYNNMLTIIIGCGELVLNSLPADDRRRVDLDEILKAARRSATLTQQLLAFSRKQVLAPCVLRLADVVGGVTPMLRRLLGEAIELQTTASGQGRVKADHGQMEQVLVNLAINARDAMPEGGRLTVATADTIVDEAGARAHAGLQQGCYVTVSVTDTGEGMAPDTQKHVFEPFFTTKVEGRGTGLGLATVYGVVKQSGGYISLSSARGRGTTFTIYLPQTGDPDKTVERRESAPVRGGRETILLVEDEPAVLEYARRVLDQQGYTVHACNDASQAIQFVEGLSATDLVVSDIVLPGMSGHGMMSRLRRQNPDLPVIYVSGYATESVIRQVMSEPGVSFLPKPYSSESLARMVREVLDRAAMPRAV